VNVTLHFAGPSQEAPQVQALSPHKFPKFQEADLLHLDAGVGLDAPEQIGTAPGSEAVSFGGVPDKADRVPHGDMISTNTWDVHDPKDTTPRLDNRGFPTFSVLP